MTAGSRVGVVAVLAAAALAGCGSSGNHSTVGNNSTTGAPASRKTFSLRVGWRAPYTNSKHAAKLSTAASAHSGDRARLVVRAEGSPATTTPQLTIDLPVRGTELKVTATASGTKPVTATLKMSGGGKIAFDHASFTCLLDPKKTFCPVQVKTTADGYRLSLPLPKVAVAVTGVVAKG